MPLDFVEWTPDPAKYQPDARDFRSWLERQPDDRFVGMANRARDCPLARWLASVFRASTVYVHGGHYTVGDRDCDSPLWMLAFVAQVDRRSHCHAPVSRAEALSYLAVALDPRIKLMPKADNVVIGEPMMLAFGDPGAPWLPVPKNWFNVAKVLLGKSVETVT